MFRGLFAVVAALLLSGCGGNDDGPASTDTHPRPPPTTGAETTVPAPVPTDGVTTGGGPKETEPSVPPPRTTPRTTPRPVTPTGGADGLVVGAVDDAARSERRIFGQLAEAGFGALAITSYWDPGRSAPTAEELRVLRETAARAEASGVRLFVSVFHRGSSTTPLTDAARAQFGSYVRAIVRGVPELDDVIVGNEPNLNRFWLPQFGPTGANVASGAYFELLAQTYRAVKDARPSVLVWGGALAPRGSDRPQGIRHTQSPGAFIRGLGEAFRASGLSQPPLDGFAFHPYPESSATPPDVPHPNPRSKTIGLADVERLQEALRGAFGRELPILYSELGVETEIRPEKRHLYTGTEVARPVDEATQADFYRRALALAACQEGVVGLLLFHTQDEPALTGFQSGVHYVDGTPKASLPAVREAILDARNGC